MGLNSRGTPVAVVIVTGSCCFPGMGRLDEAARAAVSAASAETGIPVEVEVVSATAAMRGALPPPQLAGILSLRAGDSMPLPALLVEGTPVVAGVIRPADVSAALRRAVGVTAAAGPGPTDTVS